MSLVKVVRDNYDALTVRGSGWRLSPVSRVNRSSALRAKLMEEVGEYLEDRTVEELVDVLEVVAALAKHHHHMTLERLMRHAFEKRARKGGFERALGLHLEPPENVAEEGMGTERRFDNL